MNIQRARYKDSFKTEFQIDDEIKDYCIVKLVIQPILENAIYYGVGHMDEDDDENHRERRKEGRGYLYQY